MEENKAQTSSFQIDPEEPVTQIESLCPSCEGQGITRLLLCRIPFFKDVVVMSFYCENCAYYNNEIQSAGSLAEKGIRITLHVTEPSLLNREVVKSEFATITVPEIELEIPPTTQKGSLNTVEGILRKSYEDLQALQPERRAQNPEVASKIDEFLQNLEVLFSGRRPFTLVVDDPAGNSFVSHDISRYKMPTSDPALTIENYFRSRTQMQEMGYLAKDEDIGQSLENMSLDNPISAQGHDFSRGFEENDTDQEPVEMPTRCYACQCPGTIRMCITHIPHFKETIVMAFNCEMCGAKSNEVKGGGGVSELGKRVTLKVTQSEDLTRDVIKSDTSSVSIPELGLELMPGTLGGLVTTVEGLLSQIHNQLSKNVPFGMGDSLDSQEKERFSSFLSNLEAYSQSVPVPFTLVLDDPLANSFISSPNSEDPATDPSVTIEDYERTQEQNEDLGLSDMVTENY